LKQSSWADHPVAFNDGSNIVLDGLVQTVAGPGLFLPLEQEVGRAAAMHGRSGY